MGKYAGADWVAALKETKEMSGLGRAVADLLGDVFLGIYHLDTAKLRKVDWGDPHFIEVPVDDLLCTVDPDHLTHLVVLAHDRMIRVGITGHTYGWLKLRFWQRHSRTGSLSERYPTLEDAAASIRKAYVTEAQP